VVPIDHVHPRSAGGSDELDNQAPACWRCNQAKADVVGPVRDPHTGLWVPFFHPYRDDWDEHFEPRAGEPIGRTSVGRATAAVVRRPLPAQNPAHTSWVIVEYCADEQLAAMIAGIRAAHDRVDVGTTLAAPELLAPWFDAPHGHDAWAARFAAKFLPAIARFTRRRPAAVATNFHRALQNFRQGYLAGCPAHEERWRLEWLATAASNAAGLLEWWGRHEAAQPLRELCARLYARTARHPALDNPELALRSLAHRYVDEPGPVPALAEYEELFLAQRESNAYQALGDYLDTLLAGARVPIRLLEGAAEMTERFMATAGYAAGGDVAEAIALRRRWWVLRARLGFDLDDQLLDSDFSLWLQRGMVFEVRRARLDLAAGGHEAVLEGAPRP
jgi:hypothetical protein